jgi:hypothetical protein
MMYVLQLFADGINGPNTTSHTLKAESTRRIAKVRSLDALWLHKQSMEHSGLLNMPHLTLDMRPESQEFQVKAACNCCSRRLSWFSVDL